MPGKYKGQKEKEERQKPITPEEKALQERLEDLLSERKLRQADVAKGADIPAATLSKCQNCAGEAKISTLSKLAQFFKVPSDYLIGLSDVQSPNVEIQAICHKTGLSDKAVLELLAMACSHQGKQRLQILSDLICDDQFQGILRGLIACSAFFATETADGKTVLVLTPFEAELMKQGKYPTHQDGYYTAEEALIEESRLQRRNSLIFNVQFLMEKIAERFIEKSEAIAKSIKIRL